ncbi:predicted protein [Naegleria gruberi]|uniref:Predicted protein n=1 Tax=Naegleria gruberi TaxID=5762 RepID=D2VYV3_NAEGR|nr:uncharacterized protein NAEGRDRAFT_74254 [Naegleria gruberi]EFC37974.1 predicted protein [Naegleria gruberi]|eukprot:XP_002670718.1 predicted protein [Naegleria gruberi strain NEG-M]
MSKPSEQKSSSPTIAATTDESKQSQCGCSGHHHHQHHEKPLKLFSMYPELEEVTPKDVSKSALHAILVDDNKFLWSGYRKLPVSDYWRSFLSVFTLHNETINIWNHFIPSLIYCVFAFYINHYVTEANPNAKFLDRASFIFYCVTGIFTFGFSAMYHTWRMNSINDYHFCLLCDIRGIVVLVSGANALSITLQIKDYEYWQWIYSTVNIVLVVFFIFWIRKMVRERLTNQRTIYFTIYSLIPLFTLVHRFILQSSSVNDFYSMIKYCILPRSTHEYFGISHAHVNLNIKDIMWQDNHSTNSYFPNGVLDVNYELVQLFIVNYLLLGLGMFIRGYKAPERWIPYKFDLFGASHQIFHFMSVYASFLVVHGFYILYSQGAFPDRL